MFLLCYQMQQIDPAEEKSYEWLRDIYELTGNKGEAAKQKQLLGAIARQ